MSDTPNPKDDPKVEGQAPPSPEGDASTTDQDSAAAARQAAQQAAQQAQELAQEAVKAVKTLDPPQLAYVACLAVVVVSTLIFDIASFEVGVDYAVSETVAQDQRETEAFLNSISYSAFSSTFWGKLMWASALAGVGLVIWGHISKTRAGWVPLAQIGAAGLATLLLLLLFAVGFPDLSRFSDVDTDATLFGYWVPLLAAAAATVFAVRRILPTST